MNERWKILEEKILSTSTHNLPLGLFHGKMGVCIYFFLMGEINDDKEYRRKATILFEEITLELNPTLALDMETGWTGIGLGIHYLLKAEFIKGNENLILSDIDDIILKQVTYSDSLSKIPIRTLIHILFYLEIRVKQQPVGSDDEYFFNRTISLILDQLHKKNRYSLF